jgi:toxin ParE1/3/4
MPRVVRTDPAELDLEEIWEFIARDDIAAADRCLRTLATKFEMLAARPGIGRNRDTLKPGLRSHAVGRYVVFYRTIPDGIEVVRVLHGARDVDVAFGEGIG